MAIAVKPTYRGVLPIMRLPAPSAELEDALGASAEALADAVPRVELFNSQISISILATYVSGNSRSSAAGSRLSSTAGGSRNSFS